MDEELLREQRRTCKKHNVSKVVKAPPFLRHYLMDEMVRLMRRNPEGTEYTVEGQVFRGDYEDAKRYAACKILEKTIDANPRLAYYVAFYLPIEDSAEIGFKSPYGSAITRTDIYYDIVNVVKDWHDQYKAVSDSRYETSDVSKVLKQRDESNPVQRARITAELWGRRK
jgi:hypothetical protein